MSIYIRSGMRYRYFKYFLLKTPQHLYEKCQQIKGVKYITLFFIGSYVRLEKGIRSPGGRNGYPLICSPGEVHGKRELVDHNPGGCK